MTRSHHNEMRDGPMSSLETQARNKAEKRYILISKLFKEYLASFMGAKEKDFTKRELHLMLSSFRDGFSGGEDYAWQRASEVHSSRG